MSKPTILIVNGLSIEYHVIEGIVRAVDNVSFEIRKGEVVCLVGESGSGKTTIGLAIAGALPENAIITRGRIIFNNTDLLRLKNRALQGKDITIIFQDPAATLNPLFTIGEIMSDIIKTQLKISNKSQIREIALSTLRMVELPDPERVFKSYPHELSGGMLQRAIIAIALSVKPQLLIADEPTTMLDVTLQAQILELLMNLKRKMGLSILFITHNLGVAAEIGDRIIVMYAGKFVEEAPAEELIKNPLHPYTKGLLECIPRAHIKVKRLRYIPGILPDLMSPLKGCPFYNRCSYAMDKCKTNMPKIIEITKNHKVACHLYT